MNQAADQLKNIPTQAELKEECFYIVAECVAKLTWIATHPAAETTWDMQQLQVLRMLIDTAQFAAKGLD